MTREEFDKLPKGESLQYEDSVGFRYKIAGPFNLIEKDGQTWVIGIGAGTGLTVGGPLLQCSKGGKV